ncbi:hypothetical protein M378DRAFT_15005 [Amanita muscaria Koide BX008]|uniref:Uncharacterized protein n=1 Tax=Amanita muscaria (strain Koide BX008) TaxID=946122 RepID=A0A0C2S8U6_AMAMK|nr:hypothetical protein M378DRAFT_15005 [Amanita muscaria Koide BX008]
MWPGISIYAGYNFRLLQLPQTTTFSFGPYSLEAQPLLVTSIAIDPYLFPSISFPSRPLLH